MGLEFSWEISMDGLMAGRIRVVHMIQHKRMDLSGIGFRSNSSLSFIVTGNKL